MTLVRNRVYDQNTSKDNKIYENADIDKIVEISIGLFMFYLKDDVASKFRRMLMVERYRNRRQGVILDAAVTNPDMARNFETYEIEKIKLPVLILHSKDDKFVNYEDTVNSLTRFSNYKLVYV